jgi:hypothetical protein
LTQGTLNVRVRRLAPSQVFEVDTPNLAFTLRQPGEYRIEVDPDGNATTIVMRKGQGEVYGEDASYVIVIANSSSKFVSVSSLPKPLSFPCSLSGVRRPTNEHLVC